jgi:autotransporter-associated beta strand protein
MPLIFESPIPVQNMKKTVMKNIPSLNPLRSQPPARISRHLFALAMMAAVTQFGTMLHATTFTWSMASGTNSWATQANWSAGTLPTTTSDTADFSQLDLTADTTVTLDGNQSINSLIFGDTATNTAGSWLINTGAVANATLTFGGTSPTITVNALGTGKYVQISAVVAGTGGLTVVGPGQLNLVPNITNTWSGGLVINGATVGNYGAQALGQLAMGGGLLTLTNGGRLIMNGWNSASSTGWGAFTNPIVVPAGTVGGINVFGRGTFSSGVTNSGTLNLGVSYVRADITGDWSASTGQLNVTNSSSGNDFRVNTQASAFSFGTQLINLGTSVTLYEAGNFAAAGQTMTIGDVTGVGYMSGGPTGGRTLTYLVGGRNTSSTFSGVIQNGTGPVAITKQGTGTWSLAGNNLYTGATLINTGAVYGVTGGSISNSTITVATNVIYGGSTFGVKVASAGGKWTGTNLVLRSGSVLAFNFGTVIPSITAAPLQLLGGITATNTVKLNIYGGSGWAPGVYPLVKYTSAYVGNGFSAFSLGAQPLRMVGVLSNDTVNSQIDLVVTAVNEPLQWTDAAGNGIWDIATSVNWQDAASTATTYQEQLGLGDQVLFNDAASGSLPLTVTLNSNVSPASVTFSNMTKNYVLAGVSNILGSTTLTKTGNGMLTLQNTNSFTGAVNLNGGILNFASLANNLGAGTAINFGGGTLQYAAGNTDDISTRTVTISSGGATIDTAGNNVTFTNRIGNFGAGGLTKTGNGSLTLTTNSTYTGLTTINNGTLVLGMNASLSNSPAIIVGAAGVLDATANGLTLNGTLNQVLAGNGVVTGAVTVVSGTVVAPGTNGVVGSLQFNYIQLDLAGGSLNFDVGNSSHDVITLGAGTMLKLDSGTININVIGALLTNGVYTLIQYPDYYYGYTLSSITLSGFSQPGQLAYLDDSTAGQINLVVTTSSSDHLTWRGDGLINEWDLSSLNWLTNAADPTSLANFNNGDSVRFDDSATNFNVYLAAKVMPSAMVVDSTNLYTFSSYGGQLSGAMSLTKTNTGTLLLLAANNLTGPTVIGGGTLQVGDGFTGTTALGSGNVTDNGSLIFNQPDNYILQGAISGTGSLTKQGGGILTLLGTSSYAGPTLIDTGTLQIGNGGLSGTLAPAAVTLANLGTLDMDRNGTYSLANGITGDGTVRFDGPATVTFGGVNHYLENTYIQNGLVTLTADNAIPSAATTTGSVGWLILDGGGAAGILELNGHNQTVNALSGLSGTVLSQIVNNGGSGLNTLTIGTLFSSTTYAGLIMDNTNGGSGKIGLVVNGDGTLANTLTLSGASSYSGPVLINGAKVVLASAGSQLAIGTGLVTLTNNGALQMAYYGSGVSAQGSFVNAVLVPAGTTGSLYALGRGTIAGNITNHGTLNVYFSYARSQPTGDWSASDGQFNFMTGVSPYYNTAGNISFGTAALDLGAGVTLGNVGNPTVPNTVTVGELTGTGTINDTSAGGPWDRITTYVVGGRNSNATFSGTIANAARQTAINKVGTGSWTLNGTDTYTSQTTVSAGSLIVGVSSFMANSTNITVAAGALFDVSQCVNLTLSTNQTLAGSGVITGLVTMVGSDILSPGVGAAAGTLSFSNSLTETGSWVTNNFNLSLDPTGVTGTNSMVVVAGDLTLTGTNQVTLHPLNTVLGAGTYTLFKYSGNLINESGVVPVGTVLTTNLVAAGAFATNSDVILTFSNAPGAVVMIVKPNGQNLIWQGGITGTVTNNWDVNVSSNWLNAAVVTNFLDYDNVTFDDSSTNWNAVLAGTLAPGSITVNSTNSYTFSGTGKITDGTGITKSGTNVLTISNTGGNDYTGTVTVNAGTLKVGVATALGATNGTTVITNTGALDIGGFSLGAEPIVVSGSGSGNGAILNSGASQTTALQFVTLAGDATFGGTNRWDIRTNALGAYLQGNGYNLTKTSSNDVYLVNVGNANLANVQIQQGRIGVQDNTLLGAAGTLTLCAGAGMDFYDNNSVTNSKPVSLTNATISSSSSTNVYGGNINLNGVGTFTATTPLVLNGALNGTGGLLKMGAGVLTLAGNSTYTGNTTISNAVLALVGTASIASSANVDLAVAGARLDVSGLAGGTFNLAAGQTLKGIGAVSGSISAAAGSTVAPGEATPGTLTVTNMATLGGNTVMAVNNAGASSKLIATNIVYGGTLTVNNAGGTLVAGNTFQLFSGSLSGTFAVTNLPILPQGLGWSNSLAANGSVTVVVSVNPNPTNITFSVSGSTLSLSWPADHLGWTLQQQTNSLATGLGTNWTDVAGSTSINSTNITVDLTQPTVFYRLKL